MALASERGLYVSFGPIKYEIKKFSFDKNTGLADFSFGSNDFKKFSLKDLGIELIIE